MNPGEARRYVSLLLAAGLAVQLPPMIASFVADRWHTPWWWGVAVLALCSAATGLALARRLAWAAWALWFTNVASSLTMGLVVHRDLATTAWQGNLLFAAGVTACLLSSRMAVWMPALAVTLAAQVWLRAQHLFSYEPRRLMGDLLVCIAMALIGWVLWSGALSRERGVLIAQAGARRAFAEARQLEAAAQAATEWDGFIHDEVLAVFAAASHGSDLARREAGRVLAAFENARSQGWPHVPLAAELLDTTLRIHRETKTAFVSAAVPVDLPDGVQRAFVEATAELLRNIRDHAWVGEPGVSLLELTHHEHSVRVVVQDWGQGFDPAKVNRGRLGLSTSVEARMHSIGGASRIDSRPGHGARVELSWPAGMS